ncbi:type II toxin-antitoxin system ParD family antitoxin [Oscillatoria acuminata]|uniref:Putative addiction module antidote protein, CC2985 family n=1 Tax=Oscillatoria acuminata PCC 6304 TaxID=56110 RepID=K9TEU0_9CYAN|nr:type II toxin-antitoxin system ParD family antitoxin [Oscillatoria acuminata]AFY80651.1 putative addiction module antidote protein, CC2985 family [Oscillatoria acuminata PCC 6304]
MNISLTPTQQEFIRATVNRGRYASEGEVVAAALQLLEDREKRYQEKLAELQEKITVGIESLDRGEGIDGETALRDLREKIISRSQEQ